MHCPRHVRKTSESGGTRCDQRSLTPTKSCWSVKPAIPRFNRLDTDVKADVAVVGAGITGVTAAYLIKKAGHSVALLDRGRCGGVDTSRTTAHLTYVTDLRLPKLVQRFGRDHAQATWDAGRAAMDQIERDRRFRRA